MSYPKVLAGGLLFLAIATGATVARADPIAVTFNPGVVIPDAAQFTADTLNLKNYSRVDLTDDNFTETGYLEFNNASLNNGTPFNPAGNLSTYSIYLQFNATGTQTAPNFNGSSTGTISTLSYTLYEAPGASTFGIDGSNNPFVDNGGSTPTAVATGSLIAGSTSFSANPLGAGANVSATFAQEVAGFIASPTDTTLTLDSAFNNNSDLITVLNGGTTFTLDGGGGDLSFNSTPIPAPEPATLALLGTGLIGLGAIRSLRRKAS